MKLLSRFRNKRDIAQAALDTHRYYDDAVLRITPELIEEFDDHIIIDKEVYTTCMIIGVPQSSTSRGMPRNLDLNFIDQILKVEATADYLIGVSYAVEPIDPDISQVLVDNALFNNKISQNETNKHNQKSSGTSAHSRRLDKEANDFVDIFDTIYDNKARLYDSQLILTLWSNSRDGLKNGISMLIGVMNSNNVKFAVPYHVILDTFMAAQPYPILSEHAQIQQTSLDCGQLIPLRNPTTSLAENGLIYGVRKSDNAPFVIDFDNLAAGHHLVIGSTRSGKTVFLMKMLMGLYDLLGHNVVYITPKPDNRTDYLAVAEYYKDQAAVINIGNKIGQNNINPLQVMIDHDATTKDDAWYVQQFNNHIELVMAFFRVLDTSNIMDNYVHESLMEVYRRHNIVRKDPTTWKGLAGEQWPVLLDLREVWKEDAKNKNPSAEAMLNRTTWLETTCEYINRPTDVKFDKPITIIDLSGVPPTLQDAMNVLVVGMVGMRFKTDATKNTVVMIDEGRVFLNDKMLAEMILKMYTQGGSQGLYAWFTTQQPSDAKDKDVQELLKNNSFVNVILGNVQAQSYKMIQDFFNLSDEDVGLHRSCSVGQGLVQVNNIVTAVKFLLTDLESHIILGTKKPGTKAPEQVGFELIDDKLLSLAEENHAYIEDWVKGDSKVLSPGRTRTSVQRAFKAGTTGIWIESSRVKNGKIMNQTVDHYAMVLQIASYLIHSGATVEVNHYETVDVVAKINDISIGIEYERPRSHSTKELIEKNQKAQKQYDLVLFVCTSENYKQLSADTCIGQNNTAARGSMLREYIDNIIYDAKHKT